MVTYALKGWFEWMGFKNFYNQAAFKNPHTRLPISNGSLETLAKRLEDSVLIVMAR